MISGVILPPPDMRAVVNKTAQFVAKNGRQFEAKILSSSEGQTPKFAFMQQKSPFNAYYEERIVFFQNGGDLKKEEEDNRRRIEAEEAQEAEEREAKAKADQEANVKTVTFGVESKASAVDPVARALIKKRAIMLRDREVTSGAAAAAGNGKDGGDGKDGGEGNGDAGHYGPVDGSDGKGDNAGADEEVQIVPDPISFATVTVPKNTSPLEIDVMKLAAQFTATCGKKFMQGLSRKEHLNPLFEFLKPQSSNFAYFTALVDCYSKVFRPSDKYLDRINDCSTVLGFLDLAAHRAEYAREMKIREALKSEENEGVIVPSSQIDWHDFVIVDTIEFTDADIAAAKGKALDEGADMDMEESDEDDDDDDDIAQDSANQPELKIVPDYKPRVAHHGENDNDKNKTHMVDPITGKSVPVSEMSEHMRIQLLDPKWREQNARHQGKQASTNVASGDSIVANLRGFAKKRGDIIGNSEDALLQRKMEEKERSEDANRILEKFKDKREVIGVAMPPREQQQQQQQPPQRQMPPMQPRGQPAAPVVQVVGEAGGGHRDSSVRRGVSNLPAWMQKQQQQQQQQEQEQPTQETTAQTSAATVNDNNDDSKPHRDSSVRRGVSNLPAWMQQQQRDMQQQEERDQSRAQGGKAAAPAVAQSVTESSASSPGASGDALAPPPAKRAKVEEKSVASGEAVDGDKSGSNVDNAVSAQQQQQQPQPPPPPPSSYPGGIMPPSVFLSTLDSTLVNISVMCPTDSSSKWNLSGQTVSVSIEATCTIRELKSKLSESLNSMPVNKMQLKNEKSGVFVKDANELAALNFGNGTELRLLVKSRGGKK